MATMLDGRAVARAVLRDVRAESAEFTTRTGKHPGLAAVLAGHEESAYAYFLAIQRSFRAAELAVRPIDLPVTVSESQLRHVLEELNRDPAVNGVIVLQPLPPQVPADLPSELLDPAKDVDGITPESAGRLALGLDHLPPSTPAGGMAILRHYQIPLVGRHAVVIGRSPVVGKPMALLLLAANATVTICHSHSRDLPRIARGADILVAAAGQPGMVTPDFVKPGATVIDFGVTFVDGRLVGDVDPAVADVAGALTPVPGGTGVVTNAMLALNTVRAAARQRAASSTATAGVQ
ncbi:MAG TPA: bifunctional 5,10-methylenetetrahydrofolate dehydrogenase/5,10-methenyltetrahydrofolate cyclohydrolase [Thermomicrobiaceae bacterium]|nr:bifunctional 5,10-methylenetetrahydrofolate dehydrogenase/5,10-methenyltetrahydrofolate cyclohydrolase [Thermomicrobiaceae bacterium]